MARPRSSAVIVWLTIYEYVTLRLLKQHPIVVYGSLLYRTGRNAGRDVLNFAMSNNKGGLIYGGMVGIAGLRWMAARSTRHALISSKMRLTSGRDARRGQASPRTSKPDNRAIM
jgi:hypothetical protein